MTMSGHGEYLYGVYADNSDRCEMLVGEYWCVISGIHADHGYVDIQFFSPMDKITPMKPPYKVVSQRRGISLDLMSTSDGSVLVRLEDCPLVIMNGDIPVAKICQAFSVWKVLNWEASDMST